MAGTVIGWDSGSTVLAGGTGSTGGTGTAGDFSASGEYTQADETGLVYTSTDSDVLSVWANAQQDVRLETGLVSSEATLQVVDIVAASADAFQDAAQVQAALDGSGLQGALVNVAVKTYDDAVALFWTGTITYTVTTLRAGDQPAGIKPVYLLDGTIRLSVTPQEATYFVSALAGDVSGQWEALDAALMKPVAEGIALSAMELRQREAALGVPCEGCTGSGSDGELNQGNSSGDGGDGEDMAALAELQAQVEALTKRVEDLEHQVEELQAAGGADFMEAQGTWNFSGTKPNPDWGQFSINTALPKDATILYFSNHKSDGVPIGTVFAKLTAGDIISGISATNPDVSGSFEVTGTANITQNGAVYAVPVTIKNTGSDKDALNAWDAVNIWVKHFITDPVL